MHCHAVARLTPRGRADLFRAVEAGMTVTTACLAIRTSRRAYYRWLPRWRAEGEAGLVDRSSRPRRSPQRVTAGTEHEVARVREATGCGPDRHGSGAPGDRRPPRRAAQLRPRGRAWAYRVLMSEPTYSFYPNLTAEASVPKRGIHSQTLSEADGVELVLFALAAGERLSEHTAAKPAIVHVLMGEGELTVAGDQHPLAAGSWLRMASRTPHALVARTDLVFALYLLPA